MFPTTESSKPWLADSGSAKHICADRKDTLECHEYDQEERVDQYDTLMETHELPIRLVMNDETIANCGISIRTATGMTSPNRQQTPCVVSPSFPLSSFFWPFL